MGKTVWTVATSPGGAQSSRRQILDECSLPGDAAMVHKIFLIHATHVPVNFTRAMPFCPQNRTTLHCSSHVDDSNMRAISVG